MCLPTGILSFLAKTSTIYILGFSLYCVFKYVQSGYLDHITQSLPVLIILLTFLITGACSCIGLNKKYLVSGLCTLFFSAITFGLVILINTLSYEFFDISKGCDQLISQNQLYEVFIDQNLDTYFDETSQLLCSQQCPCKWQNKTEVFRQNPKRFVVDKYNGAKSAIECPGYLEDIQFQPEKKHYLQAMIQLEVYGCSGYCKKKDFFSMSDINMGVPKHNCFDVTRHLQRMHLNSILLGMYFLAYALLILVPSTCCLFFQFSRESVEREKMYQRVQQLKTELGSDGKKLKKKQKSAGDKQSEEDKTEDNNNDEDQQQEDVQEEEGEDEQPSDKNEEQVIEEKSATEKKDD